MSSPPFPPVCLNDLTRYRLHYGANLGSVFILERWLTGSMFPSNTTGQSELSAVQGWIKLEGLQKTQARFENHWKTYISDADLDWLKNVGKVTSVRLPIGWFTLGPAYCGGTAFESVGQVYVNAWACVLALIQRCKSRGIGVLIDLHGLPGGANTGIHSGTDSGKAEFWGSTTYRALATKCLCFIAQQVKSLDGAVVGIQVVNEAITGAQDMYSWYQSVISQLSCIDPTMPIYISDAWNLAQAIPWAQQNNVAKAGSKFVSPVIIDTHLYWCFSDADKAMTAQQITSAVPQSLCELDGHDGNVVDRGAVNVLVGEYSCTLDDQTWSKSTSAPRSQQENGFGNAECKRFTQRSGGACFWTYRMDWMDGGEWGFKQMTAQGAVCPPTYLSLTPASVSSLVNTATSQQNQRMQNSVTAHCNYWDTNYPGNYEHWRFEAGWKCGFADAMAFFQMRSKNCFQGADKIGMLDIWCLKRLIDGAQAGCTFAWEFEQGLRQGVQDFYSCVGC